MTRLEWPRAGILAPDADNPGPYAGDISRPTTARPKGFPWSGSGQVTSRLPPKSETLACEKSDTSKTPTPGPSKAG